MGETIRSGFEAITKAFDNAIQEMLEKKVSKIQTPEELDKEIPMQVVINDLRYRAFESPVELVEEALEKDGFLNIGFFHLESSTYFRDERLMCPVTMRKFTQAIVLHGNIFIRRLELFKEPTEQTEQFEEISFKLFKAMFQYDYTGTNQKELKYERERRGKVTIDEINQDVIIEILEEGKEALLKYDKKKGVVKIHSQERVWKQG